MLGEQTCEGPEEFKAWSQNLGHDNVLTAFISYGNLKQHRQDDILERMAERTASPANNAALRGLVAVEPERLDRIERVIAGLQPGRSVTI
jgi:hypothetical protein